MPPKLDTRIESLLLKSPLIPRKTQGPSAHPLPEDLAGIGSEITTSFKVLPWLPFRATWVAVVTEFEWNHHFADVQKLGPFHSFHHRHELKADVVDGVSGTVVSDSIELDLGYGWPGRMVEKLFVAREIRRTFHARQATLVKLLAT